MNKINVDFSVWEKKTGHVADHIGSIPAQIIRDADEPLYLDTNTGMIYAPVMSREIFEEFFGHIVQEEITNREKFKDVFGLEIDEMASDLCDIVDHKICIDANDCSSCPVFHFWDKTYKESRNE